MRKFQSLHLLVFILIFLSGPQSLSGQKAGRAERTAEARLKGWVTPVPEWYFPGELKIDSIRVDDRAKELTYGFLPPYHIIP
ncbi:MAG: hypothetical protein U5L72_09105 [Bacteroidales bacterium]|nr:hypothetical protein [Bacteroidales bacterium]